MYDLFNKVVLEKKKIKQNKTNKMKTCLKACLHGGGGPQVGEVTRLGGVTCLSI